MGFDDHSAKSCHERIAEGAYARKQLYCKDKIIAWSHSSRFEMAKKLVQEYRGARLLDYGCGDGSFLASVHSWFPSAVGADIDPGQAASCESRFSGLTGLSFVLTESLKETRFDGAFELITCMEVLEHCIEEQFEGVLADLRRLLSASGVLVVSVPIEIGPSLLFKEAIRSLAAWRRLGDYQYKEKYTVSELFKMAFASESTRIDRPVWRADFSEDRPNFYHGHKGFNWKALRRALGRDFRIERTLFSPLGWSMGVLSSQAWFVCVKP